MPSFSRTRLLVLALLSTGAGERATLPLRLLGASPRRACWPVPFAVELPPGFLPADRRLAARRASGEELPVAAEVLSRWPGGEPRWCAVRCGRFPAGSADFSLSAVMPRAAALAGNQLRLERGNGCEVVVWQGDATVLQADERELVLQSPGGALRLEWGRVCAEVDGVAFELAPRSVTTRGPDPAGVELEARLDAGEGTLRCGELEVDLERLEGEDLARLELAFTARRSLLLRRLWIDGALGPVPLRGEVEADERAHGSSRWVSARGRPGSPEAGGGDLLVRSGLGQRGMELLWQDFRNRGPAAVELGEDGRLRIDLVAEPVVMESGQVVRHRLRVGTGTRDPAPLVAARHLRPRDLEREDRDWLAEWRTFLLEWLDGQAGVEDRGCYPTSWGTFANGEYDLGGSVLFLARELGDAGWARLGEALVQHTLDWDRAADPPDPWPSGLTWMHGHDHASHELDAGHNWLGGFAELFRGRASSQARNHAADMVKALAARTPPEAFRGPERRLAWPLRAAADWAALWGDAAARGLVHTLVQELAGRQSEGGYLEGDVRTVAARPVVWVNSWVSLGITVDALARAHLLGEPGAREVAQRLAEFVLEHAWSEGSLAQVLLVDPDTGEVLERRGRCGAGNAALAALGLRRLAEWRNEVALRELAVQLWTQARDDLRAPRREDVVEFAKALQAFPVVHSRGAPH